MSRFIRLNAAAAGHKLRGRKDDIMYYEINEEAARRGHEAYSMFDYVEGSTTAEYRRMVDKAAEICEWQKAKFPE